MWFRNKNHIKPWHQNLKEEPTSLSEHIIFRMHKDRNPLLITLEDKYKSRKYVEENSTCRLSELYYFLEGPKIKIPWSSLPKRCVIKSNHWSGDTIFVLDNDDEPISGVTRTFQLRPMREHGYYLIRKGRDQYGRPWPKWRIEMKLNRLLKKNFPVSLEWGAYNIQPRGIMIEELLLDAENCPATDIKLHCFGGKVGYIQYEPGRFSKIYQNIHLPNGDLVDTKGDQTKWFNIEEITNLRDHLGEAVFDELLQIGEELSKEIDYTRVDLFLTKDGVRFGEFTNYPRSGQPQSPQWESLGGQKWTEAKENFELITIDS